jgi:hypothetical protein
LVIEPGPSKKQCPTISVSFDSSETLQCTVKSLPLKLKDSVRMITFDYLHPKIQKSEENKFADADLIKDGASMSEGSEQRKTTSHKKYNL